MARGRAAPAPRAVAILNQKGGVGKTTVTLGLASAAAVARRKVLVVDLDPQGSSTWVLGHDGQGDGPDVADVMAGTKLDEAIVSSPWADRIDLGERRPIHAYGSRAADIVRAFDSLWTRLRRVLRAV